MPSHLLILNFHGVGTPRREVPSSEQKVWINEPQFHELLDFAKCRQGIALTFDDANESDHTIALPALQARGMKAQFFLVADRIDRPGFLSRTQIRDLVAAGMGIGNHGMCHRPWAGLPQRELREELVVARDRLEQVVGVPVESAACPFGNYDRRVLHGLRDARYKRVYTSDGGLACDDAFLQPRNSVNPACDPNVLERMLLRGSAGLGELWRRVKVLIKRCR